MALIFKVTFLCTHILIVTKGHSLTQRFHEPKPGALLLPTPKGFTRRAIEGEIHPGFGAFSDLKPVGSTLTDLSVAVLDEFVWRNLILVGRGKNDQRI